MEMSLLLRKKPNPNGPFKWMVDWENVPKTELDTEAYNLYLSKSKEHCEIRKIHEKKSFLAFLRYDYKKVLIRTRYLYIDSLRYNETQIAGSDLDFAYFEPILLCFPNLEFIGRLIFSDTINWSSGDPKTTTIF